MGVGVGVGAGETVIVSEALTDAALSELNVTVTVVPDEVALSSQEGENIASGKIEDCVVPELETTVKSGAEIEAEAFRIA